MEHDGIDAYLSSRVSQQLNLSTSERTETSPSGADQSRSDLHSQSDNRIPSALTTSGAERSDTGVTSHIVVTPGIHTSTDSLSDTGNMPATRRSGRLRSRFVELSDHEAIGSPTANTGASSVVSGDRCEPVLKDASPVLEEELCCESGGDCVDSVSPASTLYQEDCSICLQPYTLPVRLPCGHIFCFLCAKGSSAEHADGGGHLTRRCAMCRSPVQEEFWQKPSLVDPQLLVSTLEADEGHRWFYEGSGGWWQYDDDACDQLEKAFSAGAEDCRLLLAGHLYVVRFEEMMQRRDSNAARKRRVKRDLASCVKKGIAGIRLTSV